MSTSSDPDQRASGPQPQASGDAGDASSGDTSSGDASLGATGSGRLRRDLHAANRASWNAATRAHNARKRDQAAWLRDGGELLFPEELELLGPLAGQRVLHLQCNGGQDSLCLARWCASVTGVDISDEAVAFARELARDSGISARFERADLYDWLPRAAAEGRRFDLVFCSYGTVVWLSDLDAWARGIAAVLASGGALVLVDFHPVACCFDERGELRFDYFGAGAGRPEFEPEGVGDYVGASGEALAPMGFVAAEVEFRNPHPAHSFAWTLADLLAALTRAGLVLERFHEWPHSNGWRPFDELVAAPGRRWVAPPGRPQLPLMYGLRARRPAVEGPPIYRLDAFAEAPFAGNPAAVCVLERWPSAARMQALAAEIGLSETAFVVREQAGWRIRWFTPSVEVDLCGHASLAAGCVLLEHRAEGRERRELSFSSRSGTLRVSKRGDRRLVLDLPADPPAPIEAPAELLAALGGPPPRAVLRASYWLLVYASASELRALAPDFAALARVPGAEVVVTAPGDEVGVDFVSRFFGPGVGIDEDPVTGSAHCVSAPYWAERLGRRTLEARQLSARGGALTCTVLGERVELAGRCVLIDVGRLAAGVLDD